jgi:prevent-host-death family protein
MYRVGIKDLKNRLSHYIAQVRKGEQIVVTDRGLAVAVIVPAGETEETERLIGLVRVGFASWQGGKPTGSHNPVRAQGRPVSDIVLEDRR